ncbi:hypothetical protein ACOSQ2_031415 [Xanthoceras sorbifolium]|uniref:Mechanosensitive ion channel protein n=1 Tax=Xanthoceras sorbifolium TaxID=99658 RepID=A0ABQ8H1A4_9ROSI|nr:hypothetical protein JRO89_XS15G0074600 [Xanthoceras sorbifolium]
MAVDSPEKREVVIKIDGDKTMNNNNKNKSNIWRESSYDFWSDREKNNTNNNHENAKSGGGGEGDSFDFMQHGQGVEDPPTKLIGQFMHKQKASGEISLDVEVMDELEQPGSDNIVSHGKRTLPTVSESPTTQRVSFDSVIRRNSKSNSISSKDSPREDSDGEVVRCTSNKTFERNVSFNKKYSGLMSRPKSRLLDQPPEILEHKSGKVVGKSGQLKSGFLGRNLEEEDDDPLLEEDIPDEFKKGKFSIWVLLEWTSLVVIITALVCSLTIKEFKDKSLWKLKLWKWEVFVLVLICGSLVSSWIVRIVVFFIERNFLLRKRVLYFVYGLRKAVQNCLWLGLVLIAWHYLFDKKVQRETNSAVPRVVTKILVCLLVGVLLWLVKTLFVKVLASSFHVSTYFDRIQDSLFNQYVIETLSGPPLIELEKAEEEEERLASEVKKLENAGVTVPAGLKASALSSPLNGKVIGSGRLQKTPRGGKSPLISHTFSNKEVDAITIGHLHKLNPKNVSAWKMKRLINIVRHVALSTLAEQIQDSTQEDESATQIKSEYEAKAAAIKIFKNVAGGSRLICKEDLMRFMPEEEALKTMSLFEGACEGTSQHKGITKKVLKNWVVNAFRERRALALTLNDTKTAVNRLHRMVNILVGIIIVVIWLLILGIATSKFLLFVSSQLVVVAFVFGNSCKQVFEAIIFLFVMHPFDVGDRCEIDGVQMVVEEMNILTTVFLRYDNQKVIYPNSILATKPISNYYRSPDMGDAVEFCVHISTPAEKIMAMKERIIDFIEVKKKDHWYPAPLFIFKDVEELNRVRIAIWLTHKMNHQDMGERWVRRAHLVEELVKIFRELDIQYRLFPVDINVRAMPPVNSDRLSSNWTDLLAERGDKQK